MLNELAAAQTVLLTKLRANFNNDWPSSNWRRHDVQGMFDAAISKQPTPKCFDSGDLRHACAWYSLITWRK